MEDIAYKILSERIEMGLNLVEEIVEQAHKKLSDYEKMDLAIRIGIHLSIEKQQQFREKQRGERWERKQGLNKSKY